MDVMLAPAPLFDGVVYGSMALLGGGVPLFAAYRFASRRAIALAWVAVFLTVSAVLAGLGYLADMAARPPMLVLLAVTAILATVWAAFRYADAAHRGHADLAALVGFQAFRLPLELTMHRAAATGIMPIEFSFAGWNFDIVTGAVALGLFFALQLGWVSSARRIRQLVGLWNAWGICCLLIILGLAIATAPQVHFFGDAPSKNNTWVLFFPYVWLPVMLVPTAIFGHIRVTQILLRSMRVDSQNIGKTQ